MVQAKTEVFDLQDIRLADIAKALSHPARIKILSVLNEYNRCMAGEIVEMLPLSQSTVSQHLKELKRVGLIKGEIEGPSVCYCLDEEVVAKTKQAFTKLFSGFKCC
jgi:DNA-binding transcriptional ArsR family regulator